MLPAIQTKLTELLKEPIDSEAKAVYLMCQVRKLQDGDGIKGGRLRMFCNWAVHVDLAVQKTIEAFLRSIDDAVARKTTTLETSDGIAADWALVGELGAFDTFRSELREFLARHSIPTRLCDDDPRWYSFLEHYSGVIEDCTMTLKTPLRFVRGVKFEKRQPLARPSAMTFRPTWVITLTQPVKGHLSAEFTAERFAGTTTNAWSFSLK